MIKVLNHKTIDSHGPFWSKALGQNAKTISATFIRKTAVSAVHEKHKGLKKSLANLMTHSERTAEKYYNIQKKGHQDAKTAEQLHRVLRSIPSDTDSNEEKEIVSTSPRHKSVESGRGN